jgi:hypothetical protein
VNKATRTTWKWTSSAEYVVDVVAVVVVVVVVVVVAAVAVAVVFDVTPFASAFSLRYPALPPRGDLRVMRN